MEFMREGASIGRPPLLDGGNYSYWKARMKAFLKALDEKAWRAVLTGWKHPTTTDDAGETVLKPEVDWSVNEDKLASGNSKALNAIMAAVDPNTFKLISTCEVAKDAWNILQVTHEGTDTVRMSRLQLLTTKFENLRMTEDETISEFNSRLCDLSNESFALGEKMSEEKLVRKVLRSLPKRFIYKVTAIEEAKDISTMKLEELMGSLRTFEMNDEHHNPEPKTHGIALKANLDNNHGLTEDEDLARTISLLAKNFGKFMKRMNNNTRRSVSETVSDSSQNRSNANEISTDLNVKAKGIQCRECHGFGHIQAECANTLKKRNKSYNTRTWSDEDSEEEDIIDNFLAFTARDSQDNLKPCNTVAGCVSDVFYNSDSEVSSNEEDEEELTLESVTKAYGLLYSKWNEVVSLNQRLYEKIATASKEKDELLASVASLNEELKSERSQQDKFLSEITLLKKNIRMLNSGTSKLDEILCIGKTSGDHHGLGYQRGGASSSKTIFVPSINSQNEAAGSRTVTTVSATPAKASQKSWVCHYCAKKGHIKPWCYKLLKDLKKQRRSRSNPLAMKKVWKVKDPQNRGACTPLKVPTKDEQSIVCGNFIKEDVAPEQQLADIFTKDDSKFESLRPAVGLCVNDS